MFVLPDLTGRAIVVLDRIVVIMATTKTVPVAESSNPPARTRPNTRGLLLGESAVGLSACNIGLLVSLWNFV